jgi:acyl-CoA reductase-like NAD-dependent aldehyde dehydrogenase
MTDAQYVKVPWGNVLLCSPSNSVIPVVPALITGFCSVGNNLIVAPSRKSIKTSRFVFDLLKNICKDWSFEFFDKGGENAIKEYVLNNKVKLLYFQGSSKNRTNIYSECIKSGVDLIFEGEGNQITIIEDIPDNSNINNLTTIIHKAKTVCNGQLCTAPNTVFISKHVLNLFIESYKKIDNNMEVFDFENITKKEIESILNNEILSVKLRLIAYENFDAVIKSINLNYHFGLQVSFFGKSQDEWKEKILKNIPVGRLTLNMNPIYQNSLLPWGGYNKSGYSNVVNILEKATKFVIIEK